MGLEKTTYHLNMIRIHLLGKEPRFIICEHLFGVNILIVCELPEKVDLNSMHRTGYSTMHAV